MVIFVVLFCTLVVSFAVFALSMIIRVASSALIPGPSADDDDDVLLSAAWKDAGYAALAFGMLIVLVFIFES